MIRPIPRHNLAKQNLSFPKYGEFGFDEPVGKRHLSNKLSAIHKIIFNNEIEPITRDSYNQVKMNYKGSFLGYDQQFSSRKSKSPKRQQESGISYERQKDDRNKSIEREQRLSKDYQKEDLNYCFNIVQNQYSERYCPIQPQIQQRKDSLDTIMNPYKGQPLKRQFSLQTSSIYQNNHPQESSSKSIALAREISQKYSFESIDQHRIKNPTYLNSLL